MRTTFKTSKRLWLTASLLLAVPLAACGTSDADATPTLSIDAVFTAAAQTLQAQQATQLALTPPTNTPSPSPFPTLPPASPLAPIGIVSSTPPAGGAAGCNNAAFVSDVTIPDGTILKPGEKFTKTWRIYNSGSCSWTTAYKLAFASGDALGGASTLLAAAVASGSQADISVQLTAPTTNGTFRGNWRMQNDAGVSFGNVIYVEIKVGSGSTVTPGPSPTTGPSPTGGSGSVSCPAPPAGPSGAVTISGYAERPEVSIRYDGFRVKDESGQVTGDGDGCYYFHVQSGWRGTVTPSKGGFSFSPPSRSYTDNDVTTDLTGQNFDAQ